MAAADGDRPRSGKIARSSQRRLAIAVQSGRTEIRDASFALLHTPRDLALDYSRVKTLVSPFHWRVTLSRVMAVTFALATLSPMKTVFALISADGRLA